MKDCVAIFVQKFNDHLDSNLVYMMKEDAQNYYIELVDNNARYIEGQYDFDNDKEKLLLNIFSCLLLPLILISSLKFPFFSLPIHCNIL